MKKLPWLALLAVGLATSAYANRRADAAPNILLYAEASALAAWGGDVALTPGAAIAAGVTLNDVHSVEANVMWFQTDLHWRKLTFAPVLLAYRHTFQLHRRASFDLGAALGATMETASGWGTAVAFTSGVMGALSIRLTPRSTLEAKAWLLNLEETRYGSGNIGVFTLGVNVVF